jgi:hypothetical protein
MEFELRFEPPAGFVLGRLTLPPGFVLGRFTPPGFVLGRLMPPGLFPPAGRVLPGPRPPNRSAVLRSP